MRTCTFSIMLAALLGLPTQSTLAADDGGATCCARCGCRDACLQKACQLVCEVKKETKTYYCVECQDICPLLPGGHHGCECPPMPRCGHPKTVKKLVKKEYQVNVPVYKCVVRYLCPTCSAGGTPAQANVAPGSPAPSGVPTPAAPPAPVPPPPSNVQ